MATWRLVRHERAKGAYFVLQKGRARERVGLTLGYVPPEGAERALETLQAEDDADSVGRILRWFARSSSEAVEYLIRDPEVDEELGEPEPDYGSWLLRDYFEQIYKPWRSVEKERNWHREASHWRQLLKGIGHHRLRQIDEFVLADHLDSLVVTRGRRKGQPAAGNTRRLQRSALQALMKYAYRQRHIERRPNLAEFAIEGSTRPVTDKPDPLSVDELRALLEAAEPRHRAMWAVGAGQGLRPGELVAVDWVDIHWGDRVMDVRGTKTEDSADTIPLTPLALKELRRWWELCGHPSEGVVFPSSHGGPYSGSTGYNKALASDVAEAGIERHVYPYLLRDSFATIAWSLGIEIDVARRVMRHTDEAMLQKVYCRPRPADLVDRVAAFDLEPGGLQGTPS